MELVEADVDSDFRIAAPPPRTNHQGAAQTANTGLRKGAGRPAALPQRALRTIARREEVIRKIGCAHDGEGQNRYIPGGDIALSKSMKATVLAIARKARDGDYESGNLLNALIDPNARVELNGASDEAPEYDVGACAETLATLFDPIVGYEDVKWLLWKAVTTDEPVHVLLEGPPASAKTLFLMEIARLPGAEFALGGTSTKAGLTDLLTVYKPRYLLVDEIETIDNQRDYAALLHLMENQEVIETKYRRRERVPLKTWVFAAGNDASRLPPALLSRFGGKAGVVRLKEYTSAEFLEIAANVLVQREGVPRDFAKRVATATLDLGSRDVRLSVRIGRLARTEEDLAKVVDVLRRRR